MYHTFPTLLDFTEYFATDTICIQYLELKRWNGQTACIYCGCTKVYRYADKKTIRCSDSNCKQKFNVLKGTVFEKSKISLRKWFLAIYLYASDPAGMSSVQLSKYLNIRQSSAWYLHMRIMETFKTDLEAIEPEAAEWEADEVFIGPTKTKMSKQRIAVAKKGTGQVNMTCILAFINRNRNRIFGHVLPMNDPAVGDIEPYLHRYIGENSVVYTDGSECYKPLASFVAMHFRFYHAQGIYGTGYEGEHSNGIEGSFRHFKDRIRGRYKRLTKKHLQRYWDEFCFRYNTRNMTDSERFDVIFSTIERRITYRELVDGKAKEDVDQTDD